MLTSAIFSIDSLEDVLRKVDYPTVPEGERSRKLRRIARGKSMAFRQLSGPKRRGPLTELTVWARRAAKQYGQGTLGWLCTPLWFLLENVPDIEDLSECVRLLPKYLQEQLFEPVDEDVDGPPALAMVSSAFVYELTFPFGLPSVGALACAWRRARLSGDLGTERWCSVGLAWALQNMEAEAEQTLQPLIAHLHTAFLFEVVQRGYSNGMSMPLSSAEVERFHREREAFVGWTVEQQLTVGSRPAWIDGSWHSDEATPSLFGTWLGGHGPSDDPEATGLNLELRA